MTVRRTARISIQSCNRIGIARTFEELLFQLSFCDLNLHRLVDLFSVSSLMILIVLDSRGEQRVNECSFSQTGLARNLKMSVSLDTRIIFDTVLP